MRRFSGYIFACWRSVNCNKIYIGEKVRHTLFNNLRIVIKIFQSQTGTKIRILQREPKKYYSHKKEGKKMLQVQNCSSSRIKQCTSAWWSSLRVYSRCNALIICFTVGQPPGNSFPWQRKTIQSPWVKDKKSMTNSSFLGGCMNTLNITSKFDIEIK